MYTFLLTTNFKKRYKKLSNRDTKLQSQIKKTLIQISNDPTHTSLHTHKVISAYTNNKALSSRVNGDIRIIWRFNNNEIDVIDLIDLGGHSGKNSVY